MRSAENADLYFSEIHLWTSGQISATSWVGRVVGWSPGCRLTWRAAHGNSRRTGRIGDRRGTGGDRAGGLQGAGAKAVGNGGSPGLQHRGGQPVRPGRVGAPHGGDQGRERRADLRADRLRDPRVLEPAGHERRRQQVLLRRDRHARARDAASASSIDRVTRTIADWGRDDGYFATRRRRRAVLSTS